MPQGIELDAAQREAVESPKRRLRVVAGAGTGKTTTMIGRAERCLRDCSDPSRVVLVTFTRKAASEMRKRLADTVGKPTAKRVFAGTFHSLGLRLLRRYWREAGFDDETFAILSKDEAEDLKKRAILESEAWRAFVETGEALAEKPEKSPVVQEAVKTISKQIDRWKQAGLTRAMIDDPRRMQQSERVEAMARAYLAYMEELEVQNSADFGDLLLKPIAVFDQYPELAEVEADALDHLLVDEFQDTNPVQAKLLEYLGASARSITVMGDPDQAIFTFRFATPEIMARFPRDADAVLRTNRRCTEQILAPSNKIIQHNVEREAKTLVSGREGADVMATGHASHYQEGAFIAARVEKLIRNGVSPDEIAILMRSCAGPYVNALEESLMKKEIPYRMVGGTPILERAEIRDLLGYLQLAVDPSNAIAFRRVCNKPRRGIGPTALNHIEGYAARRQLPFYEVCALLSDPDHNAALQKKARDGAKSLADLLYMIQDMYQRGDTPGDIVDAAMTESGYRDWIANESDTKRIHVDKMIRAVRASDALGYFLQEASLIMDHDESEEARVRISTVHSAKGLEWDHVICPALEEGLFPHSLAIDSEQKGDIDDPWVGPGIGGLEEERRLAHVAFTRARETLHLTWSGKRGSYKSLRPSRFFTEAGLEPPKAYDPKSGGKKNGSKASGQKKQPSRSREPASADAEAGSSRNMADMFAGG